MRGRVGDAVCVLLHGSDFPTRLEAYLVMPVLGFRLMLLGKQSINQYSNSASVPIPKANGSYIFRGYR